MAYVHSHGTAGPATPRTTFLLVVTLVSALLLTLVGVWLLWPDAGDVPDRVPAKAEGTSFVDVTVTGPADLVTGSVPVELPSGEASQMQAPGPSVPLSDGDRITAVDISQVSQAGVDPLVFMDYQRELPIALLALVYAAVVLLVARWRGLAAMAGLGTAFVVLLGFTMPALLAGESAIGVALVTSSLVMFVTLYLAHGLSARTSTALLGTLVGLVLTALLATWASGAAQITGTTAEASAFLPSSAPAADLRGIALCGIILAGMGVLNDVTITQASAVWELRGVAPAASRTELFTRAMRIGRDHIASTVYTIAFAYVGATLPLLMMVWLVDQSPATALSSGGIAEEVVRTLVGSIGLVLAIPVTTAIATLTVPGPVEPGAVSPAYEPASDPEVMAPVSEAWAVREASEAPAS
ncbi:YibE/F-like protein [Promicromonospora umidemergens]|uniref:YibE/F-like protein n=1 Tax=Promicromonospora umidemergens TaxID=629679 RepID=A0ABP8XNI1_9MICO|nr:YibE/F family protein [Promicromonospora umidemergens]MCP2282116.1 YibE/F-like protein [Promicromonospora umidemergens]